MSIRILVVDDKEENDLRSRVLPGAGYEVFHANDSEQAMQLIHLHRPELIVLIPPLRGEGNPSFCVRAKNDEQAADIPIILLSDEASGTDECADEILESATSSLELLAHIKALQKLKTMRESMRASEGNYRQLFREMLGGLAVHEIICDEDGRPVDYRFLDVSPGFEKLTGLKAADLIGKTVLQVLPDTEPIWIERYGRVALTREPAQFEHYSQALSKYFEARAFSPEAGKFATIFYDVTERTQAELLMRARLRLGEYAETHTLAETLQKTLDEVCEITDSPIGFYHTVGADQQSISLQAWSTRTLQEYCTVANLEGHYPLNAAGVWADAIRLRQPMTHNDYAALPNRRGLPEGHAALQRELVVPILRNDLVVAILGVGNKSIEYTHRDVELATYFADGAWEVVERKHTQEQLAHYTLHLEKMVDERTNELSLAQEQLLRQERLATLGQLAGSVSHELRNPLAVITNSIYFLRLIQPDSAEKVKEYHQIIQSEAERAGKIIGDLLDFSRMKSAERDVLDVRRLINSTLERFHKPEGVQFNLSIAPQLPRVFADEQQVTQVLGNLLTNAYQALPSTGGKLLIEACQQDDMIEICVQDNGSGIVPENMARLFEPLFTTKGYGIGLGLALSKKLIELNQGRIEARSRPGEGATFTIYLPIAPD